MGKESGNGHDLSTVPIPPHVKQSLSQSQLKPLFGQHDLPNALNMLVQPGNEVRNILMRARFASPLQRQASMHLLALDREFEDSTGVDEDFDNFAAAVSDFGLGRQELVKAIIGDANMKAERGGFGSWLKKKAGFDDNKD